MNVYPCIPRYLVYFLGFCINATGYQPNRVGRTSLLNVFRLQNFNKPHSLVNSLQNNSSFDLNFTQISCEIHSVILGTQTNAKLLTSRTCISRQNYSNMHSLPGCSPSTLIKSSQQRCLAKRRLVSEAIQGIGLSNRPASICLDLSSSFLIIKLLRFGCHLSKSPYRSSPRMDQRRLTSRAAYNCH